MFAVLPDGAAAIEGAPVELTLAQLNTIASGNVTSLGEDHGFTGYFVRSGQQFQVFYASPDSKVMVPGILRDAQGKDITRDQVAKIPGAIPTVEVSGQGRRSSSSSDFGGYRAGDDGRHLGRGREGRLRYAWSGYGATAVHDDRPTVHLFGACFPATPRLCSSRQDTVVGHPTFCAGLRRSRPKYQECSGAAEQAR